MHCLFFQIPKWNSCWIQLYITYLLKLIKNWLLIDFNGMSIHLELFYALRSRSHLLCMFIFPFFVLLWPKSFFFTGSNQTEMFFLQIYLNHRWGSNIISHWVRANLGIMTVNLYSTHPRYLELEPHHQTPLQSILSPTDRATYFWGELFF